MDPLLNSLEYLSQGGWIMLPLGASSLVMWMLIVERLYRFRSWIKEDIGIGEAIEAVRSGSLNSGGEGMRCGLVRDFLKARSGDARLDSSILAECAKRIEPRLERSLATISVLAVIAPLLGLLGTVIGMIETFDVISIFGTGNAKAMAGGISVALITTQSGLLIAIPGLFLSGILRRRADSLSNQLREATSALSRCIQAPSQTATGERG